MLKQLDSDFICDWHKIGDSLRVAAPVILDYSHVAQEKLLEDVLLDRAPEIKTDLYTINSIAYEYDAYIIKDNKIYLLKKSKAV